MAQRSLFLGDVESSLRRIDEAASMTLNVQRVSIWFLDEQRTKIRCADLFDRGTGQHTAGAELFAELWNFVRAVANYNNFSNRADYEEACEILAKLEAAP